MQAHFDFRYMSYQYSTQLGRGRMRKCPRGLWTTPSYFKSLFSCYPRSVRKFFNCLSFFLSLCRKSLWFFFQSSGISWMREIKFKVISTSIFFFTACPLVPCCDTAWSLLLRRELCRSWRQKTQSMSEKREETLRSLLSRLPLARLPRFPLIAWPSR